MIDHSLQEMKSKPEDIEVEISLDKKNRNEIIDITSNDKVSEVELILPCYIKFYGKKERINLHETMKMYLMTLSEMISFAEAVYNQKIPIPCEMNNIDNLNYFKDAATLYFSKDEFYRELYLVQSYIHPIKAYNDIVTMHSMYNEWPLHLTLKTELVNNLYKNINKFK